jgi:hypothetical protein
MNRFLLFLLIFCSSSCTVVRGDRNKGTYLLATVGGDVKQYAQTSEGAMAGEVNNSSSFQKAITAAQHYIWAQTMQNAISTAAKSYTKINATNKGAEVEKVLSSDSVKKAEISAEIQQKQLELTEPIP